MTTQKDPKRLRRALELLFLVENELVAAGIPRDKAERMADGLWNKIGRCIESAERKRVKP